MKTFNLNLKTGLLLTTLLVVLVTVFYVLFKDNRKYDWVENYSYKSDQPYGTDMLYSFLEDYNKKAKLELIDKESITTFLQRKDSLGEGKNNTYFIVGNELQYSERDYKSLENFMYAGNTVFIISSILDYKLINQISTECANSDEKYSSLNDVYEYSVKVNFENKKLRSEKGYFFFYEYLSKRSDYNFHYFGSDFCRYLKYETLGEIEPHKPNFIKINVGKGHLLLHSNPIFFSNRHLIREDAFDYANKALSYIPDGNIYWDNHSKPIKIKKPAVEGNEDDTPFTYILKQRSFRWAFYLIYVAVFLFLVFNLFRKQRQIPVLFQNKNTSLEFIKNVGSLYFENKDNKQLAQKIMLHFMNEIRLKYFISDKNEEVIIEKLASKTKLKPSVIQDIFTSFAYIEKQDECTDEDLVKFYLKIEKFHKSIKK